MKNLRLSHCFVYVLDQDEALDFYTRVLGMEVRTDARMDVMRWLTVAPRDQPDVEINLMAIGPPVPPEDVEPVRRLVAKGTMGALIFRTDDCRAAFERVREAGAEVLQEPIEQDYGVLDCAFRDPSGNHVRIGQDLAPAA
ncbi:MAG TPA: VOC family protein [Solirubrobacteraceae bacterium]|nr:VOC family protein [Solirubrobacteraceae bacterium]